MAKNNLILSLNVQHYATLRKQEAARPVSQLQKFQGLLRRAATAHSYIRESQIYMPGRVCYKPISVFWSVQTPFPVSWIFVHGRPPQRRPPLIVWVVFLLLGSALGFWVLRCLGVTEAQVQFPSNITNAPYILPPFLLTMWLSRRLFLSGLAFIGLMNASLASSKVVAFLPQVFFYPASLL